MFLGLENFKSIASEVSASAADLFQTSALHGVFSQQKENTGSLAILISFLILRAIVYHLNVCMCAMYIPTAHRGQNLELDLLDLELQMAVGPDVVQEPESMSSTRTNNLNHSYLLFLAPLRSLFLRSYPRYPPKSPLTKIPRFLIVPQYDQVFAQKF